MSFLRGEFDIFPYFCFSFLNDMMQIIYLKGKDKQLYRLLAPLVMDPEVIRANNNYPFKTGENYVWFVAIDKRKVVGFVPVERRNTKRAVINNYYVKADGVERETILLDLLRAVIKEFDSDEWTLNSVSLVQDKETFEKIAFVPMDQKWTRYVKMVR